jgi:hypothetical protein
LARTVPRYGVPSLLQGAKCPVLDHLLTGAVEPTGKEDRRTWDVIRAVRSKQVSVGWDWVKGN